MEKDSYHGERHCECTTPSHKIRFCNLLNKLRTEMKHTETWAPMSCLSILTIPFMAVLISSKSLLYAHLHCCCGTRAWATCTYITHHNTFDISISIQISAILLKLNSKLSQKVPHNSNMLSSHMAIETQFYHICSDANKTLQMQIILTNWKLS
jgi:hypothetical protein